MNKKLSIKNKPDKLILSKIENRPWGNFQQFTENIQSTVKIINVKSYGRLSLQYHNHRDEFWKVLTGECAITIGEDTFLAKCGSQFFIPRKIKHRIAANASLVQILEISFGHFDEADITRIEDDYKRIDA